MLQVLTENQMKQGTLVEFEGYVFKVKSSVDLDWLTKGDKKGYLTTIEKHGKVSHH